jgi:hypothetical protein
VDRDCSQRHVVCIDIRKPANREGRAWRVDTVFHLRGCGSGNSHCRLLVFLFSVMLELWKVESTVSSWDIVRIGVDGRRMVDCFDAR